jgi:hypothetical protein
MADKKEEVKRTPVAGKDGEATYVVTDEAGFIGGMRQRIRTNPIMWTAGSLAAGFVVGRMTANTTPAK